jgi:serine/threonine-protein kinase RsbT
VPQTVIRVEIASDVDIVAARQTGRSLAEQAGFGTTDMTLIATAISEIARNITSYAGRGHAIMRLIERDGRRGIEVVAVDHGPGISDVPRALEDGFSTGQGLGLGLPGARRLMDDFEVESEVGVGTTVTMRKWLGPG